MVAVLIGILMSLGIINSANDYDNLSQSEKDALRIEWTGDDSDGL